MNQRKIFLSLPDEDVWMREFYFTFAQVKHKRQAGTTVMRRMALVVRMKLPSNMAAPGRCERSMCVNQVKAVTGLVVNRLRL